MRRVVIVDDSEINLTLFRHLVARLGECEALTFADPRAGLDWCLANDHDLLIVDYMMPGLHGLDFVAAYRQSPACAVIPALMITASNEKEVRHQALQGGATDFLTKPVDSVEFLARARNMLALREHDRSLRDRADWLAAEVSKATEAIRRREHELLLRISRAAEYRDPETGAHIQRMSSYSALIARQLGLPAADCEMLLAAAPMHDVGKIGIPDHILLKPGRLTPEEFEIMKTHAQLGHDLLKGSEAPVLEVGALIAGSHHEKFDGSGYPNGVAGEAIPLFGRIVAVADVFDALLSSRPYKKPWTLDAARQFLQDGSGSHFDPACVAAFFAGWDEVLAIRDRFGDE